MLVERIIFVATNVFVATNIFHDKHDATSILL